MVYREVIMKGVLASMAAVCGFVVLVTPVSGAIKSSQEPPSTRYSPWHS